MRKFYIIKHNPNTVDAAVSALKNEHANALEPDVTFRTGGFWVYDSDDPFDGGWHGSISLEDYCTGLANALLNDRTLNLALIAWDLKTHFSMAWDFAAFQKIINEKFNQVLIDGGYGSLIPMLFTSPDSFDFMINKVAPFITNGSFLNNCLAIGTDGYNNPGDASNNLNTDMRII